MKKIKKHIVYALGLLSLGLGVASCNFLEIAPEGKLPEEEIDFTQTESMYEVVSGVYAKVRTGAMHWVIWPLTIVRDDDVWSGRVDDQVALVDFGNYKYDNAFWGLNEMWNQYYGIIKVANAALEALDTYAEYIPEGSDLMRDYRSYSGEVRFLRAYAYYRLVQGFGDVTILETNTQTDLTRSTREDVYRYALADLEYTMQHTPRLRPNQMKHAGAVSAFSAAMLAAKIHLNMGDYAKVEELTDDIIANGRFSLYADFYQLFKIPGKLSDESLFEVQNTDFGQGSGDMIDSGEWFVFQGPANNTLISGWGFIGIYPEMRAWARDRGETIRATTSFLEAGTTTPSGDVIVPLGNPTQTDCWNGKAYTPSEQLTPGRTKYGTNNNIRIFRYAEVLLMNAEAKVRQGKSGDAPLNEVRARAKMPEIKGATLEQILDERRMELVCEWGERYNDLVRTGKAQEVLGPKGWTKEKTYYPLPFAQVTNIPELKNPPKGSSN